MNKEIYYEGWLIKSPPTKRIWRARWRRRWFTLKQGEIPGQFCLEYYTDRNCRKLKGVIDLDQCEQVDSGLRLEHRKQKFQYMFDIKTPKRIYYLAADTESDMRDWVNCICQVCNLHDLTKQQGDRQYYNLCENDAPIQTVPAPSLLPNIVSTAKSTEVINNTTVENRRLSDVSAVMRRTEKLSLKNTYQNNDFSYVNTEYSNRETVLCDSKLKDTQISEDKPKQHDKLMDNAQIDTPILSMLERSQSLRQNSTTNENIPAIPNHTRTQSLNDQTISKTIPSSSTRKVPENLVLSNTSIDSSVEPSPALSTSSGPYIPISECFSGSPKYLSGENPTTPLNNLDPKFYDTPRSYNNIGLNLTNDQSYSPKIYNCQQPQVRSRSGRSSPTDSESVFTDDEEWSHSTTIRGNIDRNLRPSDSSVENDAVVFTYTQRFSKMPDDCKTSKSKSETEIISDEEGEGEGKGTKRKNRLALNSASEDEKVRDLPQYSDTDNTSPAIGPKDASSCVDESYDIPRSHQLPYYKLSQFSQQASSPENPVGSSTPNLTSDKDYLTGTLNRTLPRAHYYTNAAPTKVEGDVFRYDFMEQPDVLDIPVPPVNRNLKPKLSIEGKSSTEHPTKPPISTPTGTLDRNPAKPPSVDRKLKPPAFRAQSQDSVTNINSLRRPGVPASLVLSSDTDFNINHKDLETRTLPRNTSSLNTSTNNISQKNFSSSTLASTSAQSKSNSQLQYFDLDVANPPPQINRAIYSNNSLMNHGLKLGSSLDSASRVPIKSSVVYNSVDFIKTEAFKRVREDAEKSRMKD